MVATLNTSVAPGYECPTVDDFVRGGGVRTLTIPIKRQQATDPAADGGALINQPLVTAFNLALKASGVRKWASRVTTPKGGDHVWPMSDDRTNVAALVAENAAITPVDITYGALLLNPYNFVTSVKGSVQWWDDRFDGSALGHLGRLLGQRIRLGSDAYFLTGTGTAQPNGLFTAVTTAGTLASATAITAAELKTLEQAVDPAYWENGGWVLTPALAASAKGLTSQFSRGADGVGYLRGYPMYVSSLASGIAFGDLSRYLVHDAGEIQLTVLRETAAINHQVILLASYRADGDLFDPTTAAIRKLVEP